MRRLLFLLFLAIPSFAVGQVASTSINGVAGPFSFTGGGVSCTGLHCTFGGGGGSGTVTSVTFTGDGVVLSSTPSSAVTTSGTLTATLATQTANTVLGALTATTPSGLAVPSCSTASSALSWTSGTGFGCNTSVTAAAVPASGITGTTLPVGIVSSSLTSAAGGSFGTAAFVATGTSGGTVPLLNGANTYSGASTFSAAGAASTPGLSVTGASFVGTGTTSTPQLYVNQGTAPSSWSTGVGGTLMGGNAVTGFTGNFIDFHLNGGASLFSVSSNGTVTAPLFVVTTNIATSGSTGFFASASFFNLSSAVPIAWTSGTQIGTRDTTMAREGAGIVEVGSSTGAANTGTLDAAVIKTSAFTQQAATNTAGTCSMSTGTTCTATIGHTYTTPLCVASQSGVAASPVAAECSVSGTTVTVTAASSNSSTFAFFAFGNPN